MSDRNAPPTPCELPTDPDRRNHCLDERTLCQDAIEVLTVDDDDGDLGDGTPHYAEICAAFAAHSIDCPGVAVRGCMYFP